VERAADVLIHFTEADQATFGVTEIADALGLSKAAVHRILASLRTRGLIELDELTRRYFLGVGAMKLGLAYLDRIELRRIAHPELVTLSERTGETATLSVRSGWTRFYVDQVTPQREVIMSVRLGTPYPLHAGGSSKAFLAFLSDDEIDAYLAQPELARLTPGTVTDRAKLRREITQIRRRRYAQSFAERQAGAASVAAPVLDYRGRPQGVVSVCGPVERFRGEADASAEALLEVTQRLSSRLGHATAPLS
jgi:DNA-binding IclR family transcriptional regulator